MPVPSGINLDLKGDLLIHPLIDAATYVSFNAIPPAPLTGARWIDVDKAGSSRRASLLRKVICLKLYNHLSRKGPT